MSNGTVCRRTPARSLFVWLGCATAAAWADCPPGYQPSAGAGGCQAFPMTPSAMCSAVIGNQFPPTSPGYNTKEFQQKKQEAMAACIKHYEEQAKSGQAMRVAPQPADGARAVAPSPRTAAAQRETAPARVAAPHERVRNAPMLEKVLPDVMLTCALTAKGVKPVASGGYPTVKRMYELTATNTSGASVPAGYRILWSVQPLGAVPAPAQGAHQVQAALAPNAQVKLGTVLAAHNMPLQQCKAVARL